MTVSKQIVILLLSFNYSLDLSFFKYINESSSSFYALQSYKFTHELDRFYDEPIKKALSKVTLDQLLDEDSQIFLNDTTREIIKAVGIEEYKNQTHRLPIHREKDKYIYPLHFDWTRYLLVLAVSILLGDVSITSIVMKIDSFSSFGSDGSLTRNEIFGEILSNQICDL